MANEAGMHRHVRANKSPNEETSKSRAANVVAQRARQWQMATEHNGEQTTDDDSARWCAVGGRQ